MFEIIKWPQDMAPVRCPIHFTNELEVAASPNTIWSLIVDTNAWPKFYPNIDHVQLLHGHDTLQMGTVLETSFAGQDVLASVQKFEPIKRIAWGGHPKVSEESKAYHAWILTPTPAGCHIWMEETMRGPHWIALAKEAPDGFWLAHEQLLVKLAQVAIELEASLRPLS